MKEINRAYQATKQNNATFDEGKLLAVALRDTLAELRKAEFWKEHHLWKSACGAMRGEVVNGVMQPCTRPEHDWTNDQWRELADRELNGK